VNDAVDIVLVPKVQEPRLRPVDRQAVLPEVYASNLKRSSYLGPTLGSLDLFVPTPGPLHVHCHWGRDQRGRERIVLPRVKIETPSGALHFKSLLRWHLGAFDERFQKSALRALHELIAREAAP
jgi:hypothetical protein